MAPVWISVVLVWILVIHSVIYDKKSLLKASFIYFLYQIPIRLHLPSQLTIDKKELSSLCKLRVLGRRKRQKFGGGTIVNIIFVLLGRKRNTCSQFRRPWCKPCDLGDRLNFSVTTWWSTAMDHVSGDVVLMATYFKSFPCMYVFTVKNIVQGYYFREFFRSWTKSFKLIVKDRINYIWIWFSTDKYDDLTDM